MDKRRLIIFAVVGLLGFLCGFFTAKGIYDRPVDESVTHDTVTLHDTVPDIAPKPKDSVRTKTVIRWLPLYFTDTDTVTTTEFITLHDSVQVEVPITSKHYSSPEYDAYVSGFEVNMDSIFIYKETQYITTTIVKEKQQAPLSLSVQAGADYLTGMKELYPYVKGNLEYNISKSRFSIGAQGGVYRTDKTEPFAGGYVKIKVF